MWKWLAFLALLFLVTYNPRTGGLTHLFDPSFGDYKFGKQIPVEDASGETQSDRHTGQSGK